jgi:hypothetical protein
MLPDFRVLFHKNDGSKGGPRSGTVKANDFAYGAVLRDAGYGDKIDSLKQPSRNAHISVKAPFDQAKLDAPLDSAGDRLQLRQNLKRTPIQVSWEAKPGASTGILPGIFSATLDQQREYLDAIADAVNAAIQRFNDGVKAKDAKIGFSLKSTLLGPSAWQGDVAWGMQTFISPRVVGNNQGGYTMDAAQRNGLTATLAALGKALNQEGVYWNWPLYTDDRKALTSGPAGVDIDFGRSLTQAEMRQLYDAIHRVSGSWEWSPANTRTGVRLLNFSGKNLQFFAKIRSALGKLPNDSVFNDWTARTFTFDGDAIENNWQENPNGEGHVARLGETERPDIQQWGDGDLQVAVDAVNRDFSQRYGWGAATRADRDALGVEQPEPRDGGGRSALGRTQDGAVQAPVRTVPQDVQKKLDPLPGAPKVPGFHGPDPRLVRVAEQYARGIGINLKRQAAYVAVDPVRARRIADAYAAMPHAPNDPKVREAFQNLVNQTKAQYQALVDAGYRFWFIDLSIEANRVYNDTPWNAMRDIRATQTMGVFPTNDGFGSDADFDPANNPLLEDTGLTWPRGGLGGKPARVLANDLFRAVHDAFGHGLEGAGFRAQGEENAWQAHVRLFTGSAVGAITTETRGQNSWLNFGPYGDTNRAARVEDTVFADQKTGLMPEWTWTEGLVGDADLGVEQPAPRSAADPAEREVHLSKLREAGGEAAVSHYENLRRQAHENKPDFDNLVRQLAEQVGGRPVLAPVKGDKRAIEKIVSDYNGAPKHLKDLLRATVAVGHPDDVERTIETLAGMGHEILKRKNSWTTRETEDGYLGGNVVVRFKNVPAEIQFNTEDMLAAKDVAHKLYEEHQSVLRRGGFTVQEERKAYGLLVAQKAIYQAAAAASDDQKSTNLSNSARSTLKPLTSRLPVNTRGSGWNAQGIPESGSRATGTSSTSKNAVPSGRESKAGLVDTVTSEKQSDIGSIPAGRGHGTAYGQGAAEQMLGVEEMEPRFFSPLAKAFESSKSNAMPAGMWKLWLTSNKAKLGLKDDEIQWSGVLDYLDLRGKDKATKAEIADYLSGNGVKVASVVKGDVERQLDLGRLASAFEHPRVPDDPGVHEET